jgi:hypothetical protein
MAAYIIWGLALTDNDMKEVLVEYGIFTRAAVNDPDFKMPYDSMENFQLPNGITSTGIHVNDESVESDITYVIGTIVSEIGFACSGYMSIPEECDAHKTGITTFVEQYPAVFSRLHQGFHFVANQ